MSIAEALALLRRPVFQVLFLTARHLRHVHPPLIPLTRDGRRWLGDGGDQRRADHSSRSACSPFLETGGSDKLF